VPAPMTSAVEPGAGEARFRAWIATDRGSRRAAASNEMCAGSLQFVNTNLSSDRVGIEKSLLMTPVCGMIDPLL
jgi:hypothetical protein